MNTKTEGSGSPDFSATKDKLMEDLRTVLTDAEELLRATASQAGEGVTAARARIQENINVVKARLGSAENSVMERTRESAKATDRYVHDNPWKSIGISAGAGVIIGMLIARR